MHKLKHILMQLPRTIVYNTKVLGRIMVNLFGRTYLQLDTTVSIVLCKRDLAVAAAEKLCVI